MDEFIGIVKLFAGAYAPEGWAMCNGQTMFISQNQALYSIIGTTYGGDGVQTFKLPNLQGITAIGAGDQYPLGQAVGSLTTAIAPTNLPTLQGNIPALAGTATGNVDGATVSIAIPCSGVGMEPSPVNNILAATDAGNIYSSDAATGTLKPFAVSVPGSRVNLAVSINASPFSIPGGNQPINNMQPSLALNYIICTSGLYPSRP